MQALSSKALSSRIALPRRVGSRRVCVVRAEKAPEAPVKERKAEKKADKSLMNEFSGLGDALGPIGLTYSGGIKPKDHESIKDDDEASTSGAAPAKSIARMTTAEWRAKYERDGTVDLWVEEEFNSGSRLVGGRAVYWGGVAGSQTGEGPSLGDVPVHTITIHNPQMGQTVTVEVPEDRYILWEAEDAGLELPYACRMGCCTACAVRVKSGELRQVEALGVSQELRDAGYGLMCVAYPVADCELEVADEDEVYELQFGRYFEAAALDPNAASVERDDFALEIAMLDE